MFAVKGIELKLYSNEGNEDVLSYIDKQGTVLDVGCGAGDNAKLLLAKGLEVTGITISPDELAAAKPFLKKGYLYNLENGLPSEVANVQYDYIICSHVLEHICHPEKLLADLLSCLEKDGRLIVALPNLFHYSSRWQLLRGNFNYQNAGIWDNTHVKWYTYETGKSLLEKHGFRVTLRRVTGNVPAYSVFSKLLPASWLKKIYAGLVKLSPGLFGYQLIFIATR